ncbi:DMT family transporter [Pontibaca salina]|uniref:DMT family transporter n=1 Tax=Pontibaca salina TaxID=2795731 RepID=A0A934HRZ8_9RHOB|nr:DMT family transporter [Pontibaca salina]MBI6629796.1 DMT family transporter [Pontibaca salina]
MDNLRGALLMTLSMLGFAFEDMLIKMMADSLPTWQIIGMLGAGGALVFGALTVFRREALFNRAFFDRAILLRNLGELIGTIGYVTAITLTPISSASAILQVTPLAVTLGAALFLREPVGWRRWSAILIGFFGVMLVIRPGYEGFDALSLITLVGVFGLAMRDLATRRVARSTSSFQLSFLAFAALIPATAVLALFSDHPPVAPTPHLWGLMAAALAMTTLAYYAIVAAMRVGEVSYVTPFRYSRLLFAMVIGVFVFHEALDAPMLIGSAFIVGSGVYTVWRERRVRAVIPTTPSPGAMLPLKGAEMTSSGKDNQT